MAERTGQPTVFYLACRDNDIDLVARFIYEAPLEEIDRMEPNNSTALHVACYRGHAEIVRLLLERGFTRCVRNKYKLVPFKEARHEAIRQLFLRPEQSNRFGCRTSLEEEKLIWTTLDGNRQHALKNLITDKYYKGNHLEHGVFREYDIYERLKDMPKIDVIRRYLRRAVTEKDLTYFIQAYTADTEFAKHVNEYLLSRNEENGFLQFVQTISLNEQLHKDYHYEGYCYRCICVDSEDQLSLYQARGKLVNRTFISATRKRHIAEEYIRPQRRPGQYLVTMIFKIRECGTALNIGKLSEFPFEKEVLIMPDRVFEVKELIRKDTFDYDMKIYQEK